MLYQIVSENGQKVKKSITGNGYGLPLGSIIAVFSTLVPDGFLPCNGATFDTTTYAALYAYLGSNTLPDLRNKALMGANPDVTGKAAGNTSDVGEFQLAQLPNIKGLANAMGPRNYNPDNEGCFDNSYYENNVGWTSGGENNRIRIKFDASLYDSSDINKTSSLDHLGNNVYFGDFNNATEANRTFGEVRPANVRVNYCIKATPAYVEPDTVSDMMAVVNRNNTYSLEETPTGKTWIDGKPIYRKVMTNPSYSGAIQNTWVTLATIFPGQVPQNVDRVTTAFGHYISNALGTLVYVGDIVTDGVNVSYPSRIDKGVGKIDLTIEYTKTTD